MDDYTYGRRQEPLEVLLSTYEVLMAGGYPTDYYTNHARDVLARDEVPAGLPGYARLHAFFTSVAWHEMVPRPDLGQGGLRVLSNERDELVLFTRTGRGALVVPAGWQDHTLSGYRMHMETGERQEVSLRTEVEGKHMHLQPLFGQRPAVAHVTPGG